MDIRDFENNGKYKIVLPGLYLLNFGLMLVGPFFFPQTYQVYIQAVFAFVLYKSFYTLTQSIVAFCKGIRTIRKE